MSYGLPYTTVPVLYGDAQKYEVISGDGRPTGIIRDTKQSANGAAQTLNQKVAALKRRRSRVEARKHAVNNG